MWLLIIIFTQELKNLPCDSPLMFCQSHFHFNSAGNVSMYWSKFSIFHNFPCLKRSVYDYIAYLTTSVEVSWLFWQAATWLQKKSGMTKRKKAIKIVFERVKILARSLFFSQQQLFAGKSLNPFTTE